MRGFFALVSVALLSTAATLGGNTVRITSPYFSFLISEPDEWTLDLQSASQIAHFVLTPKGVTWRTSDLVIFGRFVRAESSDTLESFLQADKEKFAEGCKSPQVHDLDWDLEGAHPFQVRSYVCPGTQDEIVAVAQVPRYFAVFILSAQLGGNVSDGKEAFKEVLNGFRWLGRSEPNFRHN